MQFMGQGNTHC